MNPGKLAMRLCTTDTVSVGLRSEIVFALSERLSLIWFAVLLHLA